MALSHAASVAGVPGSSSLVELPAQVRTLSLTQLSLWKDTLLFGT